MTTNPFPGGARLVQVAVTNQSTRVSDADASLMTAAANVQAAAACTLWGIDAVPILFLPHGKELPPGAAEVTILDDSDQADALGYHATNPDGSSYGRVFAAPTLDHGGTVMSGPLSVSVTLTHEVLELLGDPSANRYALDDTGNMWAVELADQVENDAYPINVPAPPTAERPAGLVEVSVSNFLLPEAFDPGSAGPYDHMGLCTHPFEIRPGGYAIVNGQEKFSAQRAEWQNELKQFEGSRTSRRKLHWARSHTGLREVTA